MPKRTFMDAVREDMQVVVVVLEKKIQRIG